METTLIAAVTEQLQEEGGKRAIKLKCVNFYLLSAMFGYVYQRYYRDHDDS